MNQIKNEQDLSLIKVENIFVAGNEGYQDIKVWISWVNHRNL